MLSGELDWFRPIYTAHIRHLDIITGVSHYCICPTDFKITNTVMKQSRLPVKQRLTVRQVIGDD